MTSVAPYGRTALASQRATGSFTSLKAEMADLQAQLATGKKATTFAGLGASGALRSLAGRQTLASIEAYASNVTDAQLRLKVMATGIEQIDRIGSAMRISLAGDYQQTPIGKTKAMVSAADGLNQVIDILNQEVAGRYLFSGRAATKMPVVDSKLMVEGDGTRAGLRQIIVERREADLGADGLGRVTMSDDASGITISEEAAGLPFGMKIAGASTTGSGLVASTSVLPASSASLAVASQPQAGDTLTLSLRMPDGTTTDLTLTAGADANGFAIGGTASETAANLQLAVRAAVARVAGEKLAAASALGASQAFFAGSPSSPPLRVAGPPYATATTTVAGTAADTVVWYQGDDAAGSARETQPVRTGEGGAIGIGARANEAGFRSVLAALGALVAQDFPPGDLEARQRYQATTEAIGETVGEGVHAILVDFSGAGAGLDDAEERLGLAKTQVEDTLAGIEDADPNDVAMKLLQTQTRLQASYQTTSVVAKMSLVDFI